MFVVINQLHIPGEIDTIVEAVRYELDPLFKGLKGFRRFDLVKSADDWYTVLIYWETGDDANYGAGVIGPTFFAKHISPRLASDQQRTVGPVLVSVEA
jgi:hypothetical protein